MSDFFEIDFLDVETRKTGDAITLRYQIGDYWYIHVVPLVYLYRAWIDSRSSTTALVAMYRQNCSTAG